MSDFRSVPEFSSVILTTATGTTYEPGWARLGMFGLRRTSPSGKVRVAECPDMVRILNLLLEEKVEELEAYFK